jgi:multidrug efflux pump subunit AcrA (membrane-fusion protein)
LHDWEFAVNRYWLLLLLMCSLTAGCAKAKAERSNSISLVPMVKVVEPGLCDIHRTIAQPGIIEPFEQTAIYSKIAGFVEKWCVDIGAKVKKDDLLVELDVPELAEELKQKDAQVEQQKAMVNQADKLVRVAESNLQAATDAVAEAEAGLSAYESDVKRWKGEVVRLTSMVRDRTINPENLAESQNKLDATQSAYAAATAAVRTKKSQERAAAAQIEKAKADLTAAEAQVKVAEADERRLKAMFDYTKIDAPYDGVITSRNVNTGDFIRPASGDSSAGSDGSGSGSRSGPLFVIARTDPVMFVIGVPEVDAPYVKVGTKATLRVQALAGREFNVQISRTSLALHNQSRTLQAEIDLPNPQNELLPGMYAYGSIEVERPHVRAIPNSATVQIGNRMCCFLVNDGKAVRTQIQSGVSDGKCVEVFKRRTYPTSGEPGNWEDFTGSEQVIAGDLSEVADGKQVKIETAK